MQKLETLHYYVFTTMSPLLGHLEDQFGEFLESWMAYLDFEELPDLITYYTTIGNGRLLKEEYTTIKECTLLKDIEHFMYLTQLYFSDNTPNQILHITSTLLLWSTFLHYYWSISYPIQVPGHHTQKYNMFGLYPNKCEFSNLLYYHHLCTQGRCCITCMIQINLTNHLSVIPSTWQVHLYVIHMTCLSVIPTS